MRLKSFLYQEDQRRSKKIKNNFGNPPKLPPNTIEILDDYDKFVRFVAGARDAFGKLRQFDSELKYIFNFLKKHVNKGDKFVIEVRSTLKVCSSCEREFVMLEKYLTDLGVKVKIKVKANNLIESFEDLRKLLNIK